MPKRSSPWPYKTRRRGKKAKKAESESASLEPDCTQTNGSHAIVSPEQGRTLKNHSNANSTISAIDLEKTRIKDKYPVSSSGYLYVAPFGYSSALFPESMENIEDYAVVPKTELDNEIPYQRNTENTVTPEDLQKENNSFVQELNLNMDTWRLVSNLEPKPEPPLISTSFLQKHSASLPELLQNMDGHTEKPESMVVPKSESPPSSPNRSNTVIIENIYRKLLQTHSSFKTPIIQKRLQRPVDQEIDDITINDPLDKPPPEVVNLDTDSDASTRPHSPCLELQDQNVDDEIPEHASVVNNRPSGTAVKNELDNNVQSSLHKVAEVLEKKFPNRGEILSKVCNSNFALKAKNHISIPSIQPHIISKTKSSPAIDGTSGKSSSGLPAPILPFMNPLDISEILEVMELLIEDSPEKPPPEVINLDTDSDVTTRPNSPSLELRDQNVDDEIPMHASIVNNRLSLKAKNNISIPSIQPRIISETKSRLGINGTSGKSSSGFPTPILPYLNPLDISEILAVMKLLEGMAVRSHETDSSEVGGEILPISKDDELVEKSFINFETIQLKCLEQTISEALNQDCQDSHPCDAQVPENYTEYNVIPMDASYPNTPEKSLAIIDNASLNNYSNLPSKELLISILNTFSASGYSISQPRIAFDIAAFSRDNGAEATPLLSASVASEFDFSHSTVSKDFSAISPNDCTGSITSPPASAPKRLARSISPSQNIAALSSVAQESTGPLMKRPKLQCSENELTTEKNNKY